MQKTKTPSPGAEDLDRITSMKREIMDSKLVILISICVFHAYIHVASSFGVHSIFGPNSGICPYAYMRSGDYGFSVKRAHFFNYNPTTHTCISFTPKQLSI